MEKILIYTDTITLNDYKRAMPNAVQYFEQLKPLLDQIGLKLTEKHLKSALDSSDCAYDISQAAKALAVKDINSTNIVARTVLERNIDELIEGVCDKIRELRLEIVSNREAKDLTPLIDLKTLSPIAEWESVLFEKCSKYAATPRAIALYRAHEAVANAMQEFLNLTNLPTGSIANDNLIRAFSISKDGKVLKNLIDYTALTE